MIDRDNCHDILAYLAYRREVRQNAKGTLDLRWNRLRHLLEWADATPLAKGAGIRPTFPEYLTTASNGRTKGETLSYRGQTDTCKTVQAFLRWVRARHRGYRRVDPAWIGSLHPKRQGNKRAKPEAWAIGDVRKIAAYTAPTLTLGRVQAASVMMFLSGMRVGAFVTLPIKAVDLEENEIKQRPEWGMHTMNLQKGTTSLPQIPDLLEVVRRWDRRVRAALTPADLWFAHIKVDGSGFLSGMTPTDTRTSRVRKDMRRLSSLAGVEYKAPHALRHGFALYGKGTARDIGDLEAIRHTLMHESLTITDQIDGVFGKDDVKDRLAGLGQKDSADVTTSALTEQLATLREMVQELVDQNRSSNGPKRAGDGT